MESGQYNVTQPAGTGFFKHLMLIQGAVVWLAYVVLFSTLTYSLKCISNGFRALSKTK
ncbi:hypothetical protein BH11PLA2_BH11PLA2_00040 [soil metagenome]